jgi:hypothetical protein
MWSDSIDFLKRIFMKLFVFIVIFLSLPVNGHEFVEFQPPFELNPPVTDYPVGIGSYYSFKGETVISGEYRISWRQYAGKYNLHAEIVPNDEDKVKIPAHKEITRQPLIGILHLKSLLIL